MTSHAHRALRSLVLGIVAGALPLSAGPLPAPQLKLIKTQEPQRTAQALGFAQRAVAQLGLPAGTSFRTHKANTTQDGRTVVRMVQTLGGVRVYGGGGIAHVEPDGQMKLAVSKLLPVAAPLGGPRLTPDEALAFAKAHLKLKGELEPPTVEQVVFPSELTGGLQVKWDAEKKRILLDQDRSIHAKAPQEAAVWAYEVTLATHNKVDGRGGARLVVDANTGAVLRKQSTTYSADAPAKATGRSQYSGDVTLDVSQAADGTYSLRDLTRGELPNPYWSRHGYTFTGLMPLGELHDGWVYNGNNTSWYDFFPARTTPVFGDGAPFLGYPHELDANGETAAVDTLWGMATTWDLYKNVFGRNGLDGLGTTPMANLHVRNNSWTNWSGTNMDNAYWDDYAFSMFIGDGTYAEDRSLVDDTGKPLVIPGNPGGYRTLSELTIIAHELSHGLMGETAALSYGGESGGMNEANSDIFAALAEAYASRAANADPSLIPNAGASWLIGYKSGPQAGPMRFMKKPSKDFLSVDAWYRGISWLDVHFSSGPLNRWFYFLSQGAPTSATDEAYSPYLPGGMAGIGNDKAGRIWFKTLTERLIPWTPYDYHSVAAEVVTAAEELYGVGSPEVLAVKQAYRAINVQIAGEPLLTRVSFPILHTDGWAGQNPGSTMSRTPIVPMGVTVTLKATVENNTDPRVSWKVGSHLGDFSAPISGLETSGWGVIHPDGTWTTPYKLGWCTLTAASAADPLQFTQGLAQVVNLDTDDDAEQDAVDMATTALSYYMPWNLEPTASPYGGPWVEDIDADFFQIAIRTAWGVPRTNP